jgi:hypothetical protein
MRVFVISILLAFSVQSASAGGSVDWDVHALPLLRKAPDLLRVIEQSLDVQRVGDGLRVGSDSSGHSTVPGLEVGTRIPPFEFAAHAKGTTGSYSLSLVIHSGEGRKGTWIEIKPKI